MQTAAPKLVPVSRWKEIHESILKKRTYEELDDRSADSDKNASPLTELDTPPVLSRDNQCKLTPSSVTDDGLTWLDQVPDGIRELLDSGDRDENFLLDKDVDLNSPYLQDLLTEKATQTAPTSTTKETEKVRRVGKCKTPEWNKW
jgi:hypothetical protein